MREFSYKKFRFSQGVRTHQLVWVRHCIYATSKPILRRSTDWNDWNDIIVAEGSRFTDTDISIAAQFISSRRHTHAPVLHSFVTCRLYFFVTFFLLDRPVESQDGAREDDDWSGPSQPRQPLCHSMWSNNNSNSNYSLIVTFTNIKHLETSCKWPYLFHILWLRKASIKN